MSTSEISLGITQITFNEDIPEELLEKAKSLRSEHVIGVTGTVKERSSKNDNLPTGAIEVFANDLVIYSELILHRFILRMTIM